MAKKNNPTLTLETITAPKTGKKIKTVRVTNFDYEKDAKKYYALGFTYYGKRLGIEEPYFGIREDVFKKNFPAKYEEYFGKKTKEETPEPEKNPALERLLSLSKAELKKLKKAELEALVLQAQC